MKRELVAFYAFVVVMVAAGTAIAQRGGGSAPGIPGGAFPLSRLESLDESFRLGDKKKAVKVVLDEAQKSAAVVRQALLQAHAALGAAVEASRSQAEIDAAAQAYGEHAAAMAAIEMDAVAKVIAIADPDLQNPQAVRAAFFLSRAMFLKNGKWDEIPEQHVPGY